MWTAETERIENVTHTVLFRRFIQKRKRFNNGIVRTEKFLSVFKLLGLVWTAGTGPYMSYILLYTLIVARVHSGYRHTLVRKSKSENGSVKRNAAVVSFNGLFQKENMDK